MDRVLIDASNLHTGGGVQVVASFINGVHVLRTRGTTPRLADVDIEVSSQVWESHAARGDDARQGHLRLQPVSDGLPSAADRAQRYVEIIGSMVRES